jgi:wyosine [tRNA(Phe)-imidazoG37] synthetase (radical SAM superfamily)
MLKVSAVDAKAYQTATRTTIDMSDESWLDSLVVPSNKEVCFLCTEHVLVLYSNHAKLIANGY